MKALALIAVISSGCLGQSGPTSETIVFASNRDGSSNIYQIGADGEGLKQLTVGETEKWSPRVLNKNEISFLEQKGDEIFRLKLNLDTNEISSLLHPENCILDDKNSYPSPDGTMSLYECSGDIYWSGLNGRTPRNLTAGSNANNSKPAWFPNGNRIAFTTDRDGNREIYSMDLEGKDLTNLTTHPSNDEAPDVSPSGEKILFSSNRDGDGNQEIYVLDLGNDETVNISRSKDWELIGRWSADGNRIYYGSNRDSNWEIYVYDFRLDSSRNLTNSPGFDGDPQILR